MIKNREFNCKHCGKKETMPPGTKHQKYCSIKCRNKHFYITYQKKEKRRLCHVCDNAYTPRQGRPVNYCSDKCGESRKIAPCQQCKHDFLKLYKNQRFCSPKCFGDSRKREHSKDCKECGKSFRTKVKSKVFCTKKCSSISNDRSRHQKLELDPAANVFSMRWATLKKLADARVKDLMAKIEARIDIDWVKDKL